MNNKEYILDRSSATPLYEQLETVIKQWIATGYLKENGQLPSDLELADQFGVSRITVRKTFALLVEQGIVVRKPGKGTFVQPSKMPYTATTYTSFSKLMREYGQKLTNRVLELRICDPSDHVRRELGLRDGEKAIFISRLRMINGIPVALHDDYFPYDRFYPIMGADFINGSIGEILADVGAYVHRTTDLISVYVSNSKFNNLFNLDHPIAIVEIHGAAFSEDDQPIRYTRGYFRGDYFDFQYDTSRAFIFKDVSSEQADEGQHS